MARSGYLSQTTNRFNSQAVELMLERRAPSTSGVKLGLLLPFSGPYKALGEELYSGVQMANVAAGQPFDLVWPIRGWTLRIAN